MSTTSNSSTNEHVGSISAKGNIVLDGKYSNTFDENDDNDDENDDDDDDENDDDDDRNRSYYDTVNVRLKQTRNGCLDSR